MNIFAVSKNVSVNAQSLDNKRLVKMVLETAQLLSTTMSVSGYTNAPYKPTHPNHPCSKWTRETQGNYEWLLDYFCCLCDEYATRFGRYHACEKHLLSFESLTSLPEGDLTPFVNCTEFKHIKDTHLAYKAQLAYKWNNDKHTPVWTLRGRPDWYVPYKGANLAGSLRSSVLSSFVSSSYDVV